MVNSSNNSSSPTAQSLVDEPQQKNFKQVKSEISRRSDGDLTLFQLIQNSSWQDAANYVRENPFEACNWIIKPDCDEAEWRRLPLHEACIRLPTVEFIDILIKAYPQAVEEPDHNGRLPVHHACCHGASLDVVEKLVLCAPKTLDVLDVWGKDPLSVAQGAIGPNRDLVIAAVSRGSEFYKVVARKIQWTKEMEIVPKMKVRQYQEQIQTQETKIAEYLQQANEEYELFEQMKIQHSEAVETLREECKEEKEKYLELIYSIKGEVSSRQASIDLLDMIVEGKDQRLGEIEKQLRELSEEIDSKVRLNSDLKKVKVEREQEIITSASALQEERKRNESLATDLSELSARATKQNIELEQHKRSVDDEQQKENVLLQKNYEDALKCYETLTESEAYQQVTIYSLTDKLKLSNATNVKATKELAGATVQRGSLVNSVEEQERKVQGLAISLSDKVETIEECNSHLENEHKMLLEKMLMLTAETKSLEMKSLSLKESLTSRRENEESLENQIEEANSLIRELQSKAVDTEMSAKELLTALKEERREHQALQQALDETARECTAMNDIQKEKHEWKVNTSNFGATLEATEKVLEGEDTDKETNTDEISTAPEMDWKQDQALQQELDESAQSCTVVLNDLQKEKHELKVKALNLKATLEAMEKDRQALEGMAADAETNANKLSTAPEEEMRQHQALQRGFDENAECNVVMIDLQKEKNESKVNITNFEAILEATEKVREALEGMVADTETNSKELSIAPEEERGQHKALQQELDDDAQQCRFIINLEKEKNELKEKIKNLEATLKAMKKNAKAIEGMAADTETRGKGLSVAPEEEKRQHQAPQQKLHEGGKPCRIMSDLQKEKNVWKVKTLNLATEKDRPAGGEGRNLVKDYVRHTLNGDLIIFSYVRYSDRWPEIL